MISNKATRLSRPSGTSEIDYSNPLAFGLIQAVNGSQTRYSVGGFQLQRPVKVATTLGIADATSFGQMYLATPEIGPSNSSFTFLIIEIVSSSTNISTGASVYKLGHLVNASGTFISSANGTTAGAISASLYLGGTRVLGGSFVKPVGSMYTGVLRHRHGVDTCLFVDGVEDPAKLTLTNTSLGFSYFGPRIVPVGAANVLAVVWKRALSNDEIAAVSRNPWQLFKPASRRIYFDMGAGGGGTTHTVTADPVEQGSTTTRPGLTQTHVTTASAVTQGATVSRPAVTQVHVVTARAVAQGSTVNAPTVEVGSITVVTARPVVQSSTVNAPSIVQTHVLTARPSAQGATVTRPGQAQGHQAGSTRPGFEMSSRKVYVKRGKRIHIFDTAEDADEWLEAEDKARKFVNVAKPKPQAKAKVFKALDEAVPHDVVRLDVVRSMVDYLGIPVEMPTLEARQDWAEVARVALMARHMQDEEDIELLLVA